MDPKWLCRTYVLKVASRCNLNCSYCYMYNKGDSSWRSQPKVMSEQTVIRLLERIREHYGECSPPEPVVLSFHGGEPLLAGPDFFRFFIQKAKEILLPAGIQPRFTIQTNATLIDEEWCEIFYEDYFDIGISLDGKKEINDLNRVYHNGKGSFDDVLDGVKQVKSYRNLEEGMGFLVVVNIDADPVETYEFFKSLGSFDFLLPDYTHDDKDPRIGPRQTAYADWMIQVFDAWLRDPGRPGIRYFASLVEAILGGDGGADVMGDRYNDILVVETDGSYEAVDALKICGEGFTKAGTNVASESISEALKTDLASLYQRSHKVLSKQCQHCKIQEVCGGGYLPHRYSKQNGFDNPSVYCNDLLKIITHLQNSLLDIISDEVLDQTEVRRISYEEARAHLDQAPDTPVEQTELTQFAHSQT